MRRAPARTVVVLLALVALDTGLRILLIAFMSAPNL